MSEMHDMARDPKHAATFEKLLRLASSKGDAEQVIERLGWGIDPNCRTKNGRTPLIANVAGGVPNVAVVEALLRAGADPSLTDVRGRSALSIARHKLMKLIDKPRKQPEPSPSLDENGQLNLPEWEQEELDELRAAAGDPEIVRLYWQERLKAAKRVFNDPAQIERIVEILEAREEPTR
jgi:hypothetical protein